MHVIKKTSSAGGQLRLVLFMTYQPCHHSSGHTKARILADKTSCTTRILKFAKKLASMEVSLKIRVSYIYRAHWTLGDEPAMQKYRRAVAMAQLGLQLLHEAGIPVRGFNRNDWDFLVARTCRPQVRREWANEPYSKVFSAKVMENRNRLDQFVSLFLKRLQQSLVPSSPSPIMPSLTPASPPSPLPPPIDDTATESVASNDANHGDGGQTQEVLLPHQQAPTPPSVNFVLASLPYAAMCRPKPPITQLPAFLSIPILRGMLMKPYRHSQ